MVLQALTQSLTSFIINKSKSQKKIMIQNNIIPPTFNQQSNVEYQEILY